MESKVVNSKAFPPNLYHQLRQHPVQRRLREGEKSPPEAAAPHGEYLMSALTYHRPHERNLRLPRVLPETERHHLRGAERAQGA